MNTLTNAARQRAYWDAVLGVDNIDRRTLRARSVRRELGFARTPDFRVLRRALLNHVNPKILDLGGGLGVHAIALASEGNRVIVADVSGERLRALQRVLGELRLWGRVLLVQCAAEQIALRPGAVDLVWTKSVLIHTDLEPAVAEIIRCLRPGGEAVLCEPTDANPLVNLYRRLLAPSEWSTLATHFNPDRVERVLGKFADSRARPFYVISFLAFFWQFGVRSFWLFRFSLAVLWSIDRLLVRLWPGWGRRAWFVVMTGRRRTP